MTQNQYRARRQKDKSAIMPMVLREAGGKSHRARPSRRRPVFVLDSKDNRCLWYTEMRDAGGPRVPNLAWSYEVNDADKGVDCEASDVDCG